MGLAMNGKQLCLWWMLLVLLLHDSAGQEEQAEMVTDDVDMITAHVVPSTVAAMQQEASDTESEADPAPEAPPESAPEPPAEPAPQPPAEPAPELPAEPAPELPAEPAPEPPSEPVHEPPAETDSESPTEDVPEPVAPGAPQPTVELEPSPNDYIESLHAAEPDPVPAPDTESSVKDMAATPTMPGDLDYQNDAGNDAQDTSGKPTQKSSSEAPMPTKPNPVADSNSGVNCYSCSSYQKGNCDANPIAKMPCSSSSKNGCYTLIKRDTKLIMRGCLSELTEEGDKYCRKEPKLCKMCYDKLCNKEVAPPLTAGSASFFRVSLLIWIPCVIASLY